MSRGGKYAALREHLAASGRDEVHLTFANIEALLGAKLPDSAQTASAWWSNRASGTQAAAWLGAGYRVATLDLNARQVIFVKVGATPTVQIVDGVVVWDAATIRALRQHMGLTQAEFADELEVRQQTISEWETSAYQPTRASAKLLRMIAEQAEFPTYEENTPKK